MDFILHCQIYFYAVLKFCGVLRWMLYEEKASALQQPPVNCRSGSVCYKINFLLLNFCLQLLSDTKATDS